MAHGLLFKVADIETWRRVGRRVALRWYGRWQRRRVEKLYADLGPVADGSGPLAIVADGLWDNPNHFFRLRVFLEAIPDIATMRLIGILNRADDASRTALESMGFTEFIVLEDHPDHRSEDFISDAEAMLDKADGYEGILKLPMPGGLPAYTYYDTVLKRARHPQPGLDDPIWKTVLADCLRNCAIYADLLQDTSIAGIVLSHPWQSQYATLVWGALSRNIPAYHLTGYCEGIRIRRFFNTSDYATPVEQLSLDEYLDLPQKVQDRLVEEGRGYLRLREAGKSSDINARYAFQSEHRTVSRAEARRAFGVADDRKLAIVYAHVWFDFPHTFAMGNFVDFYDWMRFTLGQLPHIEDVDWILKPHPTESWYGGFRLQDMIADLPGHVRLAPAETDSLTAMTAADAVVTVHGTVGLEATAHGLPVIAADRSFYSAWGLTHLAKSRDDYGTLLRSVGHLKQPDQTDRDRALALIALSLAPTPAEAGVLKMRCDSSGPVLYRDIIHNYSDGRDVIEAEQAHMMSWLHGPSSSYSASVKAAYFSA